MERNTGLFSSMNYSLPELRHINKSIVLVSMSTRMIVHEHNLSNGLVETSWLSWLEQFKVLRTTKVAADLVTVLTSVKVTYSRANTLDLV